MMLIVMLMKFRIYVYIIKGAHTVYIYIHIFNDVQCICLFFHDANYVFYDAYPARVDADGADDSDDAAADDDNEGDDARRHMMPHDAT